jgi:hypothetical protein
MGDDSVRDADEGADAHVDANSLNRQLRPSLLRIPGARGGSGVEQCSNDDMAREGGLTIGERQMSSCGSEESARREMAC